mgnify:CR=1 FL=1
METIVSKITHTIEDNAVIDKAGKIIRSGGLVAFPTETVYGLGGDALNPEASGKIYAAKGRPSDNPLIIHICKLEDITKIVSDFPENARRLAEEFWPGPLTMVLPKADIVPKQTTGGLDTVAVRMPVDPTALAFIEAAGGYVAAPSANVSGRPSPTEAKYVVEDMNGRIEMILDDGDVEIGIESTIVDLTGEVPMLLRPGFITLTMLQDVLGHVEVDKTILDGDCLDKPKAPGMKYKHYAPKGELTIVTGEADAVITRINEFAEEAISRGEKTGIIATDETMEQYRAHSVKSAGKRSDEVSIARNLYRLLREFDDEEVTVIYSESFADGGIGQAVMNRLLKAAGHKILQV